MIEIASAALTEEFGKGFSETNIMNFKKFYLKFKELTIPQTLSEEFKKQKHQTPSDESSLLPQKGQTQSAQFELRLLPWSHYERLIRVEDKKAREWYAKEAFEQGWSFRTLNRNINTLYYERLLMSKKKQPVVNEMQDKGLSARQTRIHQITSCLGIPWITGRHLPCRIKIRDCHHQQPREILDGNGKGICTRGSSATYSNRGKRLLHRFGILQLPHQIIYFGRFEGKSHHLPGCRTDGYVSSDVRQEEKRTRRQPYHRHHSLYRDRFGCGTILYPRQKRPDVRSKIQVIPARQGRLEKRNRTTEGTVSNGSS